MCGRLLLLFLLLPAMATAATAASNAARRHAPSATSGTYTYASTSVGCTETRTFKRGCQSPPKMLKLTVDVTHFIRPGAPRHDRVPAALDGAGHGTGFDPPPPAEARGLETSRRRRRSKAPPAAAAAVAGGSGGGRDGGRGPRERGGEAGLAEAVGPLL